MRLGMGLNSGVAFISCVNYYVHGRSPLLYEYQFVCVCVCVGRLTVPVLPRERWLSCWVSGIMAAGWIDSAWSMVGVRSVPCECATEKTSTKLMRSVQQQQQQHTCNGWHAALTEDLPWAAWGTTDGASRMDCVPVAQVRTQYSVTLTTVAHHN